MPVGTLTGFIPPICLIESLKTDCVSICDCHLALLSENAFLNNGAHDGKTFLYPVGTALFDLDRFLVHHVM